SRWPGSMRVVPGQQEVREYLDLGMSVVPGDDNEPRVRLLAAEAFWPWVFPDTTTPEAVQPALEAGREAADMALRLDRPDLASFALDGVGAILMTQERFTDVLDVVDRRLELLDRIDEPLAIGDLLSLEAWVRFDLGRYAEAVEFAVQGFERTADTMPSSVVHSQAWLALARFRLGQWDRFLGDMEVLEGLLG